MTMHSIFATPVYVGSILAFLGPEELAKQKILATCRCFKESAELAYNLFVANRSFRCMTQAHNCRAFSRHTLGKQTTFGDIYDAAPRERMLSMSYKALSRDPGQCQTVLASQNIRNLVVLQIQDWCAANITDIEMSLIGKNCRQLKAFWLSLCNTISDEGVMHLRALKLQKIGLVRCQNITDDAVTALMEIPTLTDVDLSESGYRLTHVGIDALLLYLPRLTTLNLGGRDPDGEAAEQEVSALVRRGGKLRKLILDKHSGIQDEALGRLVQNLSGLQTLSVKDCPISLGMFETAKAMSELTNLNMVFV